MSVGSQDIALHGDAVTIPTNYQMVCRDRNRIAMQSDILGAYAHGIRNMLCLSGDHQQFGNHPLTKGVFDIDSIQLIGLVKRMRDDKKFLNGDEIDGAPQMFIGAAENPFAEPFEWRVYRLAKKIEAGADFIQTQCIYDMKIFREWIKQANDMGLTERIHILAGITPLKSGGMAGDCRTCKTVAQTPSLIGSLVRRLRTTNSELSC